MKIELLESSKQIIEKAITDYKPYAIILMLSGGDDSMTALAVAKYLNVPITHIMHGVTGTGIKETYNFVKKVVTNESAKYIESNAGDSYINYVMRKGFFGKGNSAHNFSYHVLKLEHFRKTVSKEIRHHKHNRKVLFINGARRLESERRKETMINPIKVDGSNIWVNIINEWEKHDCLNFLEYLTIDRSPVSKILCRSGECMCGTMQDKNDRFEAGYHFPEWKNWIDELDKIIIAKHGFGWNDPGPPKKVKVTVGEQFMCTGCKINFEDKLINNP